MGGFKHAGMRPLGKTWGHWAGTWGGFKGKTWGHWAGTWGGFRGQVGARGWVE